MFITEISRNHRQKDGPKVSTNNRLKRSCLREKEISNEGKYGRG